MHDWDGRLITEKVPNSPTLEQLQEMDALLASMGQAQLNLLDENDWNELLATKNGANALIVWMKYWQRNDDA